MLSPVSRPEEIEVAAPVPAAAWLAPYGLGWCVFLMVELGLSSKAASRRVDWESLLAADTDSLICLGFLLAAPMFWWIGRRRLLRWAGCSGRLSRSIGGPSARLCGLACVRLRPVCFSIFVAGVSLVASGIVASRFDSLPPAYHDEFSYLFQAETFLAGRVSFPSHEAARLFDQMHVLNEGRFASRYFPGTGLWMAPFVAAGHPYWGHWLAGALCAVLVFWIGRELAGDTAGLIAGLLTALSPAMALFSNLLLAHHPTLVGLGVFLLALLRMVRFSSLGWGFVAGLGLTFAVLCRPMTAASIALPFGVYLTWWACLARVDQPCRSEEPGHVPEPTASPLAGRKKRLGILAAMGIPLAAGGIGMFFYDRAITGNGWMTPYELYTDIYTPRHVYGFNNVVRGERHLGPRVIANYDEWAENLTPQLAAANALTRLAASWKWTLGILPLTLALGAGLVLRRRLPRGAWLILAGIISLHAAHVPYWFVGIEQHHYVFEAGPLWALWTAVVSLEAVRAWRSIDQPGLTWWWGALLASSVLMNFTAGGGAWSTPFENGINRVAFARGEHGQFAALVERLANPRPALVLVEADPANRHIDFVTNSPDLAGPILVGHYLPIAVPIAEVRRLFPERALYLYRVREKKWLRLDKSG